METPNRNLARIKKLEDRSKNSSSPQNEIDSLTELAWELRTSQPEKSKSVALKTIDLAQSGEFSKEPYKQGWAAGLVAYAFYFTHTNQLKEGVENCLQALNLIEDHQISKTSVRAWITLCWNNFFIGNYPTALEQALKALDQANALGIQIEKAWALDALASVYGIASDFTDALHYHKESVSIFKELNDVDGIIRATKNLAMTLYEKKDYDAAFESIFESFHLAQKWKRKYDILNISCTIAQISIDTGKLDQAEEFLRTAMANAEALENTNIYYTYVLMEWARLSQKQNDFQNAKKNLLLALSVAEENDQKMEQAKCHQGLSEIYEKHGDYKKSLDHHKAFHGINEEVVGDQATIRMSVLSITHQIDSARQEAEIYRLKAEQLHREMEEQRRIRELFEKLSRVDDLTGIANRRHFNERLEQEYARHNRTGRYLSLIMLDIDHFKEFNDKFGHIKGDDCLRKVAQVINKIVARKTDLVARFGGEEFACIMPETNSKAAIPIKSGEKCYIYLIHRNLRQLPTRYQ